MKLFNSVFEFLNSLDKKVAINKGVLTAIIFFSVAYFEPIYHLEDLFSETVRISIIIDEDGLCRDGSGFDSCTSIAFKRYPSTYRDTEFFHCVHRCEIQKNTLEGNKVYIGSVSRLNIFGRRELIDLHYSPYY